MNEYTAVEGNGMKCPECKDGFPKGGQFCPNCGFEPTKRRRLMLAWLIAAPLSVAIAAYFLIAGIDKGDWLDVIFGCGIVLLWMYLGVHNYRWLRWTRHIDAHKTAGDPP